MLLSSLVLLAMQWPLLAYPGVNYDEVMWVNVALETGSSLFIHDAVNGWPLMLMPYIGALKGYVYRAVLFFFDPGVASLRVPMILLGGAGIALLASALYFYCHKRVAVFVICFLLSNPLVGMHAALDLGPSSIEFFLKCCVIFLSLRALYGGQPVNVLLLGVVLLLGIWNKLSFVWFLNSFFLLWIILFLMVGRGRRSSSDETHFIGVRSSFAHLPTLLAFIPSYLLFGGVFYFNVFLGVKAPIEEANYLPMKVYYFFDLFSGISYYNSAWVPLTSVFYTVCSAVCLGFSLTAMRFAVRDAMQCWTQRTNVLNLPPLALGNFSACVMLLASVAQFLFTREAIQPWHAYTLFPLLAVVVATGAVLLGNSFGSTPALYRMLAITAPMVFVLVICLLARVDIARHISQAQPGKYSWTRLVNSNASGDLFKWLKTADRSVKFLDWGFMTQALFFDHLKAAKYEDLYWRYNEGVNADHFRGLDPSVIFVAHGKQTSAYPEARTHFFQSAKLAGVELCEMRSFADADGIVFAQAWQVCGIDKVVSTPTAGAKYVVDYSADVAQQDVMFKVTGDDPQVYFSVENPAALADVGALSFGFSCVGGRGDASLQVFFAGMGASGFSEMLSTRVRPLKDLVYVDVSRLDLIGKTDFQAIRIDLDPPNSCAAFSIRDLRAYGR